jgi:DNA-3-methyladenine glycosylase II
MRYAPRHEVASLGQSKRKSTANMKGRLSQEGRLLLTDPELGRVMAAVTARIGPQRIKPSKAAPFESLVRAVVYQSVSGKAATTIFAHLKDWLGGGFRPAAVVKKSPSALASVGLSGAKAQAIRGLAEWFCANPGAARRLTELSDQEIITSLTSIPGVGLWTVNVFLIFSLGRPDVLPSSDMGIRRGVQLVCNLPRPATPNQVQTRSQRWQPYRSLASIYLWNAVKLNLTQKDLTGRRQT